jgi:hypothetical protein
MQITKILGGMAAGIDHMARIEPGDYTARCAGLQPPFEYKQYARMAQRIDFVIEGDGTVLKKYVNLGPAASPWKTAPSRSEYYKLWTAAMGRRPKPGETINLDFLAGRPDIQLRVTVEDKEHEDGYTYSLIGKVRPVREQVGHPDNTQSLNDSITQSLNDSIPQVLNDSATQDRVIEMQKTDGAVDSGTQDEGHAETQVLNHSATQDQTPAPPPLPKGYVFYLAEDKIARIMVAEFERVYPSVDVRDVMDAYRREVSEDRSRRRTEEETKAEIRRRLDAARGIAA